MDTPNTIRAQELRDIYSTLSMKYLTQDERLDVLLTLKHTVKEHDCKLTQEIIELIDREADLLMRGVKESNLEGTFIAELLARAKRARGRSPIANVIYPSQKIW